jgi:hypothetical protein
MQTDARTLPSCIYVGPGVISPLPEAENIPLALGAAYSSVV